MSTSTHENAKSIIVGELRKRIWVIVSMVVFLILTILLNVALLLLFKRLIDETIPARDMSEAGLLLFALVSLPLIAAALDALYEYRRATLGEAISQALRQKLFNHLIHTKLRDLESTETGHIIHHITSGCGRIGDVNIADELMPLISNGLLFMGALVAMTFINWQLMLITLLAFPPTYIFSKRLQTYDQDASTGIHAGARVRFQASCNKCFPGFAQFVPLMARLRKKGVSTTWIRQHSDIQVKTVKRCTT